MNRESTKYSELNKIIKEEYYNTSEKARLIESLLNRIHQ